MGRTYEVTLRRTREIDEEAVVVVKAASEDEAEAKAREQVGDFDYQEVDSWEADEARAYIEFLERGDDDEEDEE